MPSAVPASAGPRFGATQTAEGLRFAVWSGAAERLQVSIFDQAGMRETDRIDLQPEGEGVYGLIVGGLATGTRYGFRADGPYDPLAGLWFDPDKLLMDPYAVALDRPYVFDERLAAPRGAGIDSAPLMPKAVATPLPQPVPLQAPLFRPGGLVYEINVRAFTMRHPDIAPAQRGTIAAIGHPAIIEHLTKLGVSAVELMPVTASIDERHLGPLGLTNAWGYNPVTFMALDPRLAPGGLAELRATVSALRQAGIGVILDLVFNHTGESDAHGPTLSLRGLDNRAYYRHAADMLGRLVNDTGTGNTIACDHPIVHQLVIDSLRHFVLNAGVDGFRFDLAPILGRGPDGFDADAPLLRSMLDDDVLKDRILIAEPWDIGPDGYQLGRFPSPMLEWNDRYRDDLRRFWRGDRSMIGTLATRLAGSADIFTSSPTRTVNFLAAHDGFALADLFRYERKHNEANGEHNQDGHNENFSWNNGVEGETDDAQIAERRAQDLRAALATLFLSRGTIMLTAGDEFGRSQGGNNNAYAQDNAISWLDWAGRDLALEAQTFALASLRKACPVLADVGLLTGAPMADHRVPDVEWLTEAGTPMAEADWSDPERHRLTMLLATAEGTRLAAIINGDRRASVFSLPQRQGFRWVAIAGAPAMTDGHTLLVPGRTCICCMETKT